MPLYVVSHVHLKYSLEALCVCCLSQRCENLFAIINNYILWFLVQNQHIWIKENCCHLMMSSALITHSGLNFSHPLPNMSSPYVYIYVRVNAHVYTCVGSGTQHLFLIKFFIICPCIIHFSWHNIDLEVQKLKEIGKECIFSVKRSMWFYTKFLYNWIEKEQREHCKGKL